MLCSIRSVNIKVGMPTVPEALARLDRALGDARSRGEAAVKIIHGYGSSGVGGKIKAAVRRELGRRKARGAIRAYVPGENWSIFDPATEALREDFDEIRDFELEKFNEGMTVVVL
jgi:hypothetical protein